MQSVLFECTRSSTRSKPIRKRKVHTHKDPKSLWVKYIVYISKSLYTYKQTLGGERLC